MGLMLFNEAASLNYGRANAVGAVLIIIGTVVIVLVRRFGRGAAGAEEAQ